MSLEQIDKIYEYVYRRSQEEKNFVSSIKSMYLKNARYCGFGIAHLLKLLNRKPLYAKYIFIGNRFGDLIDGLPREEVLIIGGPKQAIFCYKNGYSFTSNCHLWSLLVKGFQGKEKTIQIEKASSDLTKLYSKYKNAVVIVENDSLPLQRLHIVAARNAGLYSVCIQHGIFQSTSPAYVVDGWFSDKMYVFDKHHRNFLIEKGISAEKLFVMGYHSNPYSTKLSLKEKGRRRVCILGQPYVRYDKNLIKFYLKVINDLAFKLDGKGIEFIFKPHPWERGEAYLGSLPNVLDISILTALDEFDVFISFTSTALLEATIAGRMAIQLIDVNFKGDIFEEFGYAYSVKSDNFDEIISLILESDPLPNIQQNQSVSVRFLDQLNGNTNIK